MIITNFSENDRYFNEETIFLTNLKKIIFYYVFTEQNILLTTQIYWMNNELNDLSVRKQMFNVIDGKWKIMLETNKKYFMNNWKR